MDLGEELLQSMSPHDLFNINIFGFNIPVSDTVVVMWVVMAVLIIVALVLTRKMKLVPEGKQNVAEAYVDFINNFVHNNIGHHWKGFAPYLGSILLFLAFSNIISIFNIFPSEWIYNLTGIEAFRHFGIRPPTRDINVPACLAIFTILLVLFGSIRFKGFKGWLRSFLKPIPVILPFNILEYAIKPLTLCLRLFGNILGAFIVMELLYAAFPLVVPAAFSIYFDLFDGLLQAYVFVFLTTLYIAEAVE